MTFIFGVSIILERLKLFKAANISKAPVSAVVRFCIQVVRYMMSNVSLGMTNKYKNTQELIRR